MGSILREISAENIGNIKNTVFRDHAKSHLDDYAYFLESIKQYKLPLRRQEAYSFRHTPVAETSNGGIITRNNGCSLYINKISPACIGCRGEALSATHFISMRCNRKCYYCFNPNSDNYEYYLNHKRDYHKEFSLYRKAGFIPEYIGLTGGEPLIHKEDCIGFFRLAKEMFPGVHARLYTCGDLLDQDALSRLGSAGLDEIRVSVKLEDTEKGQDEILGKLELAKQYIPAVMVEMPIIPGTIDQMKALLLKLDRIGIFGINLLEFCFSLIDSEKFIQSFEIKNPPYRVLYSYGYGGGLPIAGSEKECLALLDFTIDTGLSLGVHYCSLENKFTGQIWAQNKEYSSRFAMRSDRDFFIKIAKSFGPDIPKVKKHLNQSEYLLLDDELLFHPKLISRLQGEKAEIGISLNVFENEDGEGYLRELKLLYTTPQQFKMDDL